MHEEFYVPISESGILRLPVYIRKLMKVNENTSIKIRIHDKKILTMEVVRRPKDYSIINVTKKDDEEAKNLEKHLGIKIEGDIQRRGRLILLAMVKLFEKNEDILFRRKRISSLIFIDGKPPSPQICEKYADMLAEKGKISTIKIDKSKFYKM